MLASSPRRSKKIKPLGFWAVVSNALDMFLVYGIWGLVGESFLIPIWQAIFGKVSKKTKRVGEVEVPLHRYDDDIPNILQRIAAGFEFVTTIQKDNAFIEKHGLKGKVIWVFLKVKAFLFGLGCAFLTAGIVFNLINPFSAPVAVAALLIMFYSTGTSNVKLVWNDVPKTIIAFFSSKVFTYNEADIDKLIGKSYAMQKNRNMLHKIGWLNSQDNEKRCEELARIEDKIIDRMLRVYVNKSKADILALVTETEITLALTEISQRLTEVTRLLEASEALLSQPMGKKEAAVLVEKIKPLEIEKNCLAKIQQNFQLWIEQARDPNVAGHEKALDIISRSHNRLSKEKRIAIGASLILGPCCGFVTAALTFMVVGDILLKLSATQAFGILALASASFTPIAWGFFAVTLVVMAFVVIKTWVDRVKDIDDKDLAHLAKDFTWQAFRENFVSLVIKLCMVAAAIYGFYFSMVETGEMTKAFLSTEFHMGAFSAGIVGVIALLFSILIEVVFVLRTTWDTLGKLLSQEGRAAFSQSLKQGWQNACEFSDKLTGWGKAGVVLTSPLMLATSVLLVVKGLVDFIKDYYLWNALGNGGIAGQGALSDGHGGYQAGAMVNAMIAIFTAAWISFASMFDPRNAEKGPEIEEPDHSPQTASPTSWHALQSDLASPAAAPEIELAGAAAAGLVVSPLGHHTPLLCSVVSFNAAAHKYKPLQADASVTHARGMGMFARDWDAIDLHEQPDADFAESTALLPTGLAANKEIAV